MEEREYQDFYEIFNERPCRFEKALLGHRCECAAARRLNIAEREAVACSAQAAWRRCGDLREALHHAARFALKQPTSAEVLPHAKEMKVQCGGLLGLQAALSSDAPASVADVAGLLDQALARFGRLEDFPYQEIVRSIVHFQPRRRK